MRPNDKAIMKIRAELPHGSFRQIAQRTGISEKTVGNFFRGKVKNYSIKKKLYRETINLIGEMSELENETLKTYINESQPRTS